MKAIPLSTGGSTIVDDDDYSVLSQWTWRRNSRGYVVRATSINGKRVTLRMHRVIIDAPPDMEVDHINRDRLDNRRVNLRLCTHAQNKCNSTKRPGCVSQYKGVRRGKDKTKWSASITSQGKRIHLGSFDTEIEAAKAYNDAALQMFGEFALLNPLDGQPRP